MAKLDAEGDTLVYSTLLGGPNVDSASGIAVDGSGAAYVSGTTSSTGFPTTPGALDTTYNGGTDDGFIAKVNATGSALLYSTFLGGSSSEGVHDVAVDPSGAVYVTGGTSSHGFPTTPGAYDTSHHPDTYTSNSDVFVSKLAPSGSSLTYSTFIGGWLWEDGDGIAIDASGAAYVVGVTYSAGPPSEEFGTAYPTTAGAFDRTHNSPPDPTEDYYPGDAFVTMISPSGSTLGYSTFLGGQGDDGATSVAVDQAGNATLTGSTLNPSYFAAPFPTTAGAYDTTPNDTSVNAVGDAFVDACERIGQRPRLQHLPRRRGGGLRPGRCARSPGQRLRGRLDRGCGDGLPDHPGRARRHPQRRDRRVRHDDRQQREHRGVQHVPGWRAGGRGRGGGAIVERAGCGGRVDSRLGSRPRPGPTTPRTSRR